MTEPEPHNRSATHPARNPQATTSLAEPIGPQTGNVRTTMIQVNDALHHKIDPSLISALQQGPRDRTFLLRIEKQLTAYIQQPVEQIRLPTPFPPYQRMLVHRLADYFGLARIVEKKGQEATITLIKTAESRVPDRSLQMVCEELNVLTPDERRGQNEFKPVIQQRACPSDSGEPFCNTFVDNLGGAPGPYGPLSPQDSEQFVEPRMDVTGIDYSLMAGLCNAKERKFLLKLEKEVIRQIQVPTCRNIKLTTPFMSYHRMLVHRLADYYGLARIIEKKGQSALTLITLVKCDSTRIPDRTLSMAAEELDTQENVKAPPVPKEEVDELEPEEKVVFTQTPKIMRREQTPDNGNATPQECNEAVSLEDREKQYAEARRRIFGSEQDFEEPEQPQKGCTPPRGATKGAQNVKWQNDRPDTKVKAQVDKWQDFYDPAYDRSHPQYPGKGNPLMGATPVCHTALGQLAAQHINTSQRERPFAPAYPNPNFACFRPMNGMPNMQLYPTQMGRIQYSVDPMFMNSMINPNANGNMSHGGNMARGASMPHGGNMSSGNMAHGGNMASEIPGGTYRAVVYPVADNQAHYARQESQMSQDGMQMMTDEQISQMALDGGHADGIQMQDGTQIEYTFY